MVSLATVTGDRVVSQPYPGLEGVTRGGQYVLCRAAMPIGFIGGLTTTSGQPARALVETPTLPFIGVAGVDGRFIVAARAGAADVTARVVRTSLTAHAQTAVTALATTALDLALSGASTTATVATARRQRSSRRPRPSPAMRAT